MLDVPDTIRRSGKIPMASKKQTQVLATLPQPHGRGGQLRLPAKPQLSGTKTMPGRKRAPLSPVHQDSALAIIAQWQLERPDLDFAPMAVFAALTRAYQLITNEIDVGVERFGISRGMFDVLAALRRAGKPYQLTPKRLAATLLLSGAGMTSRLDKLEDLKLVLRLPDPSDRRSLLIGLTKKGSAMADRVLPTVLGIQRKALGDDLKAGRALTFGLVALGEQLVKASGLGVVSRRAIVQPVPARPQRDRS